MDIALSPEIERLVHDKVARGEFESVDALVESALRQFVRPTERFDSQLAPPERAKAWMDFFEEVDRDPIDAPPLSDEALRRVNLYDDRRNCL